MTAAATICFLTSSDAVKERHVKAFAANVQALGMRVTSASALKSALDANPGAIVVVDQSITMTSKQWQALGDPHVVAYVPDQSLSDKDLSLLPQFAAVCFSNEKNPLQSLVLRHGLMQLRAMDTHLPLTAMLHWGHACYVGVPNNQAPYETPPGLSKGIKDLTAYLKKLEAHHELLSCRFVSDGILWGHIIEVKLKAHSTAAWLQQLNPIHALGSAFKIVNFHAKDRYELGVFEPLTLTSNKRQSEAKRPREFLLINTKQGMIIT